MKITSCDCYKEIYENIGYKDCSIRAEKRPFNVIENSYDIKIIEKGSGVVGLYKDIKCCQFCGKKIEVSE